MRTVVIAIIVILVLIGVGAFISSDLNQNAVPVPIASQTP